METAIVQIFLVVLSVTTAGLALIRIGQPPIVGYIVAGVLLGPSCTKFIQNEPFIEMLADMGIMFLLFTIGLGFSVEKIKAVWKHSLGTIIIGGVAFGGVFYALGYIFGWSKQFILIATFCSIPSSTAVTIKSLEKIKDVSENVSNSTLGILILQDIVSLLLIIAVHFLGDEHLCEHCDISKSIATIVLLLVLFFTYKIYKKQIYKFLNYLKDQTDILAACTVTFCLGGASLAIYFGTSAAFGSFIAGLILGNSPIKGSLQKSTMIIEELLLLVFFLSIGLIVDLAYMFRNLIPLLISVISVAILKTFINIVLLRFFKLDLKDAFISGVLLGHFGEFAFVLVSAGIKAGVLDEASKDFLVALTALSLSFSPFWLVIAERSLVLAKRDGINTLQKMVEMTLRNEYGLIKKLVKYLKLIVSEKLSSKSK